MIEILCTCPEGLGLAHRHIGPRKICRRKSDGVMITWPDDVVRMNDRMFYDTVDKPADWEVIATEPECIHVPINWPEFGKEVLRANL